MPSYPCSNSGKAIKTINDNMHAERKNGMYRAVLSGYVRFDHHNLVAPAWQIVLIPWLMYMFMSYIIHI
ncbi:hypothetical protein SAMN05216387_11048 [Nitrosovibrio tenuis]|uniref:Uncharacterized protein n=1 Tax=Nitrosovibrio tenuis TaxID=1233 RepID=A0A1H7PY47_9PROT|nr:hypothetical protein SAMN05216387_11048 [Nitrosovibrio tenuis]